MQLCHVKPQLSPSWLFRLVINNSLPGMQFLWHRYVIPRMNRYVILICATVLSLLSLSLNAQTFTLQGRVTDHRIGYTTHDLQGFLNGDIQDMIDALTVAENAEKLKETELS